MSIYQMPGMIYNTGTGSTTVTWLNDSVTTTVAPTAPEPTITMKKEISPKLYFSYIKSKLNSIQINELKHRLTKMHCMVEQCKLTGQKGLAEELIKLIAIAAREQEAFVYGIKQFVDRATIDKFKGRVKLNIKFKPLDEFPRMIPKDAVEKIKNVKKAGLFDEYYVLFTDVTGEETLSTEKKIQAKDPILFGRYSYAPDRWYLICDWIDEYCTLTIKKFVDQVGVFVEDIPELDDAYLESMKKYAMDSHLRVKSANSSNFKQLKEKAKNAFRRLFK